MQEVDVVYTWVNHNDPDWIELYASVGGDVSENLAHPSINNPARFQNRNEIVYSLRSVRRFAPWVRNVYVVTNCRLPPALENEKGLIFVSHEEIFPDLSVLPTFNSRAIESNFHRIPGIGERILYFNDDVFLCRPMKLQDFFPDSGKVSVFPSAHDVPYTKREGLRPVDYGVLNACRLLKSDFDYEPQKKLHHAPFPLLRSNLESLESRYLNLFESTRSHRFRDNSDLPMATTLHAYFAVATGSGVISKIAARYVDIGDPLFLLLIHPLSPLRRGKYQTLCLNEVTQPKYFAALRDRIVSRFMEKMFGF